MNRRASQSRQGMVLFPVIFMLVVVTLLLGWMLIRAASDAALANQAVAVAESAATDLLGSLQPPEYADPEVPSPSGPALTRVRQVAAANGMDTRLLAPLTADDIVVGPTWVHVAVRSRGRDGIAGQALACGLPAGRIAAGQVRVDDKGQRIGASGCLPVGIQLAALPSSGDGPDSRWISLTGSNTQAQCLQLMADVDPADHVRFLGGDSEGKGAVRPPPAVEVGDAPRGIAASGAFWEELQKRLAGRTVVVPLLLDDRVVGFGRVKLDEIDTERGAIRVTLAPSAVVKSCGFSPRSADVAPRDVQAPVAAFGLALAAQVRS